MSREDHERLLEEERRRRSGQERAHQKESGKLQRELDEVKRRLDALLTSQQTSRPSLNLNPSDPLSPVVEEIYTNQREWADYMRKQAEESERREQQDAAQAEARAAGVPQEWLAEWLDDEEEELTARSVRRAIREYRNQRRIEELTESLAQARQQTETAATAAREELGATRTFTGTGGAPPGRTVDDQLRELDQYVEGTVKRIPDQAERMRQTAAARRMAAQLQEWKKAGNRGKHPAYD